MGAGETPPRAASPTPNINPTPMPPYAQAHQPQMQPNAYPGYHPQPSAPPPPMAPGVAMHPAPGTGTGAWNAGLCDCFSDIPLCCMAWWCTCIPYGKTHARVSGNDDDWIMWSAIWLAVACFTGCQCVLELMTRQKVRETYGIQGDTCKDFMIAWCCTCCSTQQCAVQVGQKNCDGPPPLRMQ
eukprot:TRINITY_DN66429_c5_g1_i3.p1 TRINITY_DN66429_c5_g1~~TRINITY_DN66429_c5_g1_i3.p1  ORF type:complete len:183 (+),score=23.23 TRINITY_DN66429_c5_g1_i3:28-576(+)